MRCRNFDADDLPGFEADASVEGERPSGQTVRHESPCGGPAGKPRGLHGGHGASQPRAWQSHGVEDMARIIRDALAAGETREAIIRNLGMTDAEYDRLLTSEDAFLAIQGGRDKAMSA